MAVVWMLLGSFLCLQKPAFSGYEAIIPRGSTVSYAQSNNSSVRTFPEETRIPEERYGYFFNDLSFNINSRLLTGAADKLYLFDLDLNVLSSYDWRNDTAVASCNRTNDNSTYTCRNHIRIFKQLPSNDSQILACGTQADATPQCRIVELSGDVLGRGLTTGPASNGLLSYYPEYISFGEFLAASSDDERFFSAALGSTDRDFRISFSSVNLSDPSNPDTLQTTELFKTLPIDRWLDFPVTFVDYFRADYQPVAPATLPENYQFYFVFLRESLTNADVIYSRVARICRNDPGLASSSGNQFTTFKKARIFCEREVPPGRQFAGTVDFQYNEIKSMAFNDEGRYGQITDWVQLMYGAFSGPSIGPVGTAICVYKAYNGVERGESGFNRGIFDIFREDLQNVQGNEVESSFVECQPGGRSLADSELIQVVQDVSQIGENPLLVLDGLIVTRMAVDQVCVVQSGGTSCVNQDILFLGTDTGKILKVIFAGSTMDTTPVIAEEITLDDDNAVNQLNIQQADDSSKYIYASTFSKIYRLPLDRCDRFNDPSNVTDSCRSCISSRDPHCVWNNSSRSCESNPLVAQASSTNSDVSNYLQNVHTDEIPAECTFPEIGFTMASGSVSESMAEYTVTVRSSVAGERSSGLVEIYTLQGDPTRVGYATAGEDYVIVSEPVIFNPGSTEFNYPITLRPDDQFEGGDEQLIVGLQATGAGGVVISQGQFTLTITEDDTVSVRLESGEVTVSEGANIVNINIMKDGQTTVNTTVILNTLESGTAVAGEDYFPVETVVTFSPSESIQTVSIPLVNDDILESREWFLVRLSLPSDQAGVLLGSPVDSNVTIEDDDSVEFGFENVVYSTSESVGVVEVGVVKYGSSSLPLSVSLSTMSGSAISPQDFTAISVQELTFSPTQNRQTVSINIINDGIFEDSEEFTILLTPVSPQSRVRLDGSNTTTVLISDDDTLTVGFSPAQYTISEAGGAVLLNVNVNQPFEAESVVLQASLINGTATSGVDFNYLIPSTLEFRSGGDTSTQVTVAIVDDNTVEMDEEFSVQISSTNPRVTVQQGTASVTITDDDAIEFGFETVSYRTSESVGVVEVGVVKYGSSSLPLSVSLSTMSSSATSPQDFTVISAQELTFSPIQNRQTVSISIVNDSTFEDSEEFTVLLTPVSPQSRVRLDGSNTTTVLISDDDTLTVEFSPAQYTISEAGGAVLLNVNVNQPFEAESVVLQASLVNGTAISGADFNYLIPSTLEFRSGGDTSTQMTVAIVDDNTVEMNEEFSVQISSINPRVTVQQGTADVTITDDDAVEFGFENVDYSISESVGVVEVGVVKYGSSSLPLSVSLSTMSGSATSPQDFTAISAQELIFSPTQNRRTVSINIINDGIFEDSEEFTVLLTPVSTQSRVRLDGSNTTTVLISDDDRFSPTQYSLMEGGGDIGLNVTISEQFEAELVVLQVNLIDGTATSGADFDCLILSTLEFRSGGDTSTQVTVAIVDDNTVEMDEEFFVQISSMNPRVIVQQETADVTIIDDDAIEFGFETVSYRTSESVGVIEVGVVKYGSSSLPLSVNLSTMSGSATSPQDFTAISVQELIFSPAQNRRTVNISIVDDSILEDVEQFSVMLSRVTPLAPVSNLLNSANIRIIDDDRVSVSLSSAEYMTPESAGMINVGFTFGSLQTQVTFGLSTMPGTASGESDFMPVSLPITLTASSSSPQTVAIQLVDDAVLEDREYFIVQLFSTDPRVALLQPATATVWIMNDDSVSVGFESPTYTASESDCFTSVNVSLLAGSTDIPLNFNLTTTSSSAATQAGQDFVSVFRMPVIINPGSKASEVNIQLLDDNLFEKDPESFMALLEPGGEGLPQGVTIDNNTTSIYIEDNDIFTTQAVAESSAPTTGMPTTTSAGQVNEGTAGSPFIPGSLEDRCIYDSLGTSAAVLAVLLAIIVLLLLLLLISCYVLIREKRRTIAKKYLPDDLQLDRSVKGTSPDRLPMDNFGVHNKVYRENSSSSQSNNTPALKRLENDFSAEKLNSNNNGNTEGRWQPGWEDSSQSLEDLTMTKL